MLERFDDDARRVVLTARTEAVSLKRPLVETTHLLLALTTGTKGAIAKLLTETDVTYDRVWTYLVSVSSYREQLPQKSPVYTEEFKSIIERCRRNAEREHGSTVTPAHVLDGLLRQKSGLGRETLRIMGVNLDAFHSRVLVLMRRT